ncbi:INCENP_ARK-bind domain-containing protein [Caenorhabditis elegans]|uniref:INCENP_ARK-bind domain-containing protein n=2 Tax=Caenorhabditis elegans TaxID=6239 RepID=Q94170_CAEEL|nr:INCENP_ARK-bind domain-containing protein [Caenorhabditis elegans]CCD64783.1 INCENP_ARK-bind domain-containing protein [Caenorhabditis elegans]|eukprot:NP_001024409.1 Uncharacterized protein CELE_C16H3.3 [Caenorhabditis elegans]
MTTTRPKRNVRNLTPAPPVEDDATIVRSTLDRILYTVDVITRFDQTRRDIAAVHRGESDKTMAQVMAESRWHEHASKAKKEFPMGSSAKKKKSYEEEEEEEEEEEDELPSTSSKPIKTPKPTPEKKNTPSKAKLAAMKKKADAARRKAQREAKKLEALGEKQEEDDEDPDDSFAMPILESSVDTPGEAPKEEIEESTIPAAELEMEDLTTVAPSIEETSGQAPPVIEEPMSESNTEEIYEESPKIEELTIKEPVIENISFNNEIAEPLFKPTELTKNTNPVNEIETPITTEELITETQSTVAENPTSPEVTSGQDLHPNEQSAEKPQGSLSEKIPTKEVVCEEPEAKKPRFEQEVAEKLQEPTPPNPETQIASGRGHISEEQEINYEKHAEASSSDGMEIQVFEEKSRNEKEGISTENIPLEQNQDILLQSKTWKPWLGEEVELYPLDLLPPEDDLPGRVWCPPRGQCQATCEQVVDIGPLTELETLDLSLCPEFLSILDQDRGDLIIKRMLELQIPYLEMKLLDSRMSDRDREANVKQLECYEKQLEEVLEKDAVLRLKVLCLPQSPMPAIPTQNQSIERYYRFKPTWYTSSRVWFDKSSRNRGQVTQQDFLDQFQETTDPTVLNFQKEMLEKTKQVEDEAAEEKIKNFQLPLVYDLHKQPPLLRERMIQFREKLARMYQYEDFERVHMTDPACREIWKKLRPIPFENGNVMDEAEEELTALISLYKKQFARENPVIPLPRAKDERRPTDSEIMKAADRCLKDVVDTVVIRDLADLPTYPYRYPAHNRAI